MARHIRQGMMAWGLAALIVFLPFAVSISAPVSHPETILTISVVHAQQATSTAGTNGSLDTPPDCGFWSGDWIVNFFSCTGQSIFSGIGAILIYAAGSIMSIASGLFEILVTKTVIGFGGQNGILTADVDMVVKTAWTAFRNIANILIIGLFAFIAISIMLGTGNFGQSKMIARVLIVAILINFSLFFTKVIIDVSNYTATQFYYAGIGRPAQTGAAAGTMPRIGERLEQAVGTISLLDTYNALGKTGSVSTIVWISFMTFILYLAAAMVIFYGAFILASRAILLIFLMITAALAFATYLLPSSYMGGDKPGWEMWWRSLLQCAVLAPILMVFLWATLLVSDAMRGMNPDGSLGTLLSTPTNLGGAGAFLSYIIVLGMLFASFRVASSFSAGISGFNWASLAPAVAFAGGSYLAALGGQRASLAASRGLSNAAGNITSQGRFANLTRGALYGASGQLARASQRSQNLMRTGVGGVVASQVKGTGQTQATLAGKNRPPSLGGSQAQKNALKAIQDAAKKSAAGAAGGGPAPQPTSPAGGGPAIANDNKTQTAEAIKSAVAAGANESGKVAAEAVGRATSEAAEKQAEATEKLGSQLKEATGGIKEATAAQGSALVKATEGLQKVATQNTEMRATAAANDNQKVMRDIGTEREHAASARKGEERQIQVNIATAAASAQDAGSHLASLREQSRNFTNDNTIGNVETSVSAQFSRSMDKPLPDVGNAPMIAKSGPAEIVVQNNPAKPMQHTATVDADALVRQVREGIAQARRNNFRMIQGGKDAGNKAA